MYNIMNSTTGKYRSVAFIRVIRVICLFSNQVLIARKSTQIFTESQILVSIDKNVKDVTATQKRENFVYRHVGEFEWLYLVDYWPN